MANEYSAFDMPTLPSPDAGARAPLPPPAPEPVQAAPAAPADEGRFLGALPTLPSLPATPPRQAEVPHATELPDLPMGPRSGLLTPAEAGVQKKKRGLPVGPIVAVFAVAVVGITGYMVMTGDDDASDVPVEPAASVTAAADPAPAEAGGSGNVILETFDEARDVVDQINDNDAEAELLDELGLDPIGNPVELTSAAPAGYRFTWSDPSGQDLDVTVDATTGDYSVVATDGISFRFVGGAFFGADGNDEWYELAADPFGDIPVVGLGGVPTIDTVLPPAAAPYVVSDTVLDGGRVVVVDDAAFAAADLAGRNDWLRPWGLLDETNASATTVVVRISGDQATGVLTGAQLETPALGGAATFSVTEAYDVAPVIENPLSASN